ncbi:MAG: type II 3-dehydroquinate dehydratase [Planctomycetes bacterium]|nr:type II 3-dehydroquinate dehydratase [Planctomycetota bacterium]
MIKRILIVHGPNLNLLGRREPEIYGSATLAEINAMAAEYAKSKGVELNAVQFNSEGAIIDAIHESMGWANGIVLNPGAYTHYSIAIHDAVLACGIPTIEVHLSNIYSREDFRRHSVIAPACKGHICGLGPKSYLLAIDALLDG